MGRAVPTSEVEALRVLEKFEHTICVIFPGMVIRVSGWKLEKN
jgi:hypothetical protein